jgi:hypothetical protein
MAESSRPESPITGEELLSDQVGAGRAAWLHEEVSRREEQTHLKWSPSEHSHKFDSAQSRTSAMKILESAMHSPSSQLSEKKQSNHANTEQSRHGESSSSAIPRTNSNSDNYSISGSDANEEYLDASKGLSERPRCRTRRGTRPSDSASIRSKREPGFGILCHYPFNHHQVSQLYLAAALNDATVVPPKDVQDHFDNCVWRGCIDHALTVNPIVGDSPPLPAPTECKQHDSEENPSSSANCNISQQNADAHVEAALPVSENQPPPKRRQDYFRISSWIIIWIVLFIIFCIVIGQHHTPNRTLPLSSKQENDTTKIQDQRVKKWRSFSHEQAYTYTFPRFTKEQFDFFLTNSTASNSTISNSTTSNSAVSNSTVRNCTAQAQYAHLNGLVNKSWHQDLTAKTIVRTTNLTVVLNVTTNHTLDITSLCPPIQTTPKPKPSPVLISYHQKQDPKAVVFVKNLLTCLWFLPVWLFSHRLVEKLRLGWLSDNETRTRVRIAAVVVSFLVAAALALGTEVAVREIAESRKGRR